ncbi:MAG TPA: hypothetical protein PLM60_10005 [Methanoregulaceae archaeon]|nr:hypothetical protein [Methanoregulaceae archaeon]HNI42311.1 hypothetical protein [Methanoregulaceae archaeon]HNJ80437.1 hypothetical protein [Methanoregulaceae archaeon]HNO08807.1 hypothetical protein [Methanoregulaceae archaeon]HPS23721.1 hypothetical protein [Methanoregulaceae archaeon]
MSLLLFLPIFSKSSNSGFSGKKSLITAYFVKPSWKRFSGVSRGKISQNYCPQYALNRNAIKRRFLKALKYTKSKLNRFKRTFP